MIPIERNETYLLLSLPPLTFGERPGIEADKLRDELSMNLTPSDLQACNALFLLNDLENARALWLGNPLGPEGVYDGETLETRLVDQEGLPSFFKAYLDLYPNKEDRIEHFQELLLGYFTYLQGSSYPFIRFWGDLSLKAREAFFAFRTKDGAGSDETFHPLESFFLDQNIKASDLAEAVNHFLFDQVDAHLSEDPFAIERVFAYIVQFHLIHLSLEVYP